MIESWRWYGPLDRITLPQIAQTGAVGIVTALHEIPYGEIWSVQAIEARIALIGNTNLDLSWNVVESLPVHEDIKRGRGDLAALFANYRQSMVNLAACGITTICYNFMPLIDWTRTDLAHPLARGGNGLRFSSVKMAAFEVHMLGREGAEADYGPETLAKAAAWFQSATDPDRAGLLTAIMAGLPGAYTRYDLDELRTALATYRDIGRDDLRANYANFLAEIIPTAQELGIRMCVHPDDPPRDILGLSRIVSNADDIAWIMSSQDAPENGLTFCSGSLGANPANELAAMVRRFASRVHFAHLRNVAKEPDGSFDEAPHLTGDNDMVAIAAALLGEETRRREAGREDAQIPFRPDHGHVLLSDHDLDAHPGYPLIGRMRGLAELRGVIAALSHPETTH